VGGSRVFNKGKEKQSKQRARGPSPNDIKKTLTGGQINNMTQDER
jgi:hypothetical protein